MTESEVEVKVLGVFEHEEERMPPAHFVMLRDCSGRRIPIWIGQYEAWAISFALDNQASEVPMTHDLMLSLLLAAGAAVESVHITELKNETYQSVIQISVNGAARRVQARPSDALALALRAGCLIYVAEEVIAAASSDASKIASD